MQADNYTPHKWFLGVDSLRFILALIVLLSHFDNPYIAKLLQSPDNYIRLAGYFWANAFDGTAAVIAFFIISGFAIHYPNLQGIKNLKQFYIRRFLRVIIPLIVIGIAGIKFGHPEKAVVWSLICELIYYAIYPFLIKLSISWVKQNCIAYIAAFLLIISFAGNDISALLNQSDVYYHGYYWQLGPLLTWIVGLPVWLMGVVLAENIDKLHHAPFSRLVLLRLTVFGLSCFLMLAKSHMHVSYILSMNMFALLIYQWLKNEIVYYKSNQPVAALEHLGKFSYSLYLCHPVIYLCLNWVLPNGIRMYMVFITATIVISYLFYLAVERPAHLLAIRLSKPKPFAPSASGNFKTL